MLRRGTIAAVAAGALFAAAATAAVPAGRYHGRWGKSTSDNVHFTVKGNSVQNFHTTVAALCLNSTMFGIGSTFREQTFVVPKAAIHGGKVNTTYKVKDSHGNVIGKRTLTATFHGSKAAGTFSGSSPGCTIAKYNWSARH